MPTPGRADGLRAGAAVAALPVPAGGPLGGYGGASDRRATGVLDPPQARALVLGSGALRVGLVTLDVVIVRPSLREAILAGTRDLGLGGLVVVATHTHSGPGGYVEGWQLTEAGERLARLYHECDLLVSESLGAGLLDGLDPAAVAALASTFTYEARGPAGTGPAPWFPSGQVRERWAAIETCAAELRRAEDDAGLPATRPPDAGFVALAHAWAAGQELAHVIAGDEISGGDFVRNVKQLIDLLRQLGDLAAVAETATACRAAADRVFRGVVSASSVIATDEAAIEEALGEDIALQPEPEAG